MRVAYHKINNYNLVDSLSRMLTDFNNVCLFVVLSCYLSHFTISFPFQDKNKSQTIQQANKQQHRTLHKPEA